MRCFFLRAHFCNNRELPLSDSGTFEGSTPAVVQGARLGSSFTMNMVLLSLGLAHLEAVPLVLRGQDIVESTYKLDCGLEIMVDVVLHAQSG
jgi:hypothetical protein